MKRLRSEASSGAQERPSSLATEAISRQLLAICALNRISSLTEARNFSRLTFHERKASPAADSVLHGFQRLYLAGVGLVVEIRAIVGLYLRTGTLCPNN